MHQEWLTLCCIAYFMLQNAAWAMMASPRFFTEYQPDGTPVTLRLRGDEKSHWITDIEGKLLTGWKNFCFKMHEFLTFSVLVHILV